MNVFKKVIFEHGQLRDKAVQYIYDTLDYDNFLCHQLKKINFNNGILITYIPQTIKLDDIENFKWGCFKDVDRNFPVRLFNELKFKQNCIVIFDDVMANPKDNHLKALDGLYIEKENEIYFVIDSLLLSKSNLTSIVNFTAVSWHSIGVVIETSSRLAQQNCLDVLFNSMEVKITDVFVGAFDGEGYLHWSC